MRFNRCELIHPNDASKYSPRETPIEQQKRLSREAAPLTQEQKETALQMIKESPVSMKLLEISSGIGADVLLTQKYLDDVAREGDIQKLMLRYCSKSLWERWSQDQRYSEYHKN